ncbi:hypothetical protein ACSBR2_029789 [Camellia fascicularis]
MASGELPIPDLVIDIGAVLCEGIETEDIFPPILELELPPLAERPFNVATYQPRTHALTLSGILLFEGLLLGIDEDILLREPTEHLSADASMYERLPAEVCALIDAVGFGPFASGLIQTRAEPLLYGALVERWWDTTDSFHFSSIGEVTLTPYDFAMLTGLRVGVGGPIPFHPDMAQWRAAYIHLLGVTQTLLVLG